MNATAASLRDAAEGARHVREDLRVALRQSSGATTILIEQELDQIAEQTRRLKRLADASNEGSEQ